MQLNQSSYKVLSDRDIVHFFKEASSGLNNIVEFGVPKKGIIFYHSNTRLVRLLDPDCNMNVKSFFESLIQISNFRVTLTFKVN